MRWHHHYFVSSSLISLVRRCQILFIVCIAFLWCLISSGTIVTTTVEAAAATTNNNNNNNKNDEDTQHDDNIKDYSSAVVGLFNNMRIPAALICGALAPIGVITAPTILETDTKKIQMMKIFNIVLAVLSLLSEILAVTYSSIAINKLVEVKQPQTTSPARLIVEGNHELAWIGTNIHFLFGLLGFIIVVGLKVYFIFGGDRVGYLAIIWSIAAFLQTLSLINRGIAMGYGRETNNAAKMNNNDYIHFHHDEQQFASNFFYLNIRYIELLISHAKLGVCSLGAIGVASVAAVQTIRLFLDLLKKDGCSSSSRAGDEKKHHLRLAK